MPSPREVFSFIQNLLQFELFTVQQTKVTLSSIVMLCLVMLGFIFVSRYFVRTLLTKLLAKTTFDEGLQYTLTRITHYLVLVIGTIVAFQFIGVDLSSLVVIFGFLSVGIGFGLQNLTSNFISGLILLFERPIKVGDRVTVADIECDVSEINIRSTTVKSLNNISVIVPNSEFISSTVVNWTHQDPLLRVQIDVGVSYNSDLDAVLRCLKEVAVEHEEVLKEPEPDVLFKSFGDSAWDMQLRAWIEDPKRHPKIRSDLNCAIVRKFRQNKIEIPFPQRDLHIRSPLPVPHLIENNGGR